MLRSLVQDDVKHSKNMPPRDKSEVVNDQRERNPCRLLLKSSVWLKFWVGCLLHDA